MMVGHSAQESADGARAPRIAFVGRKKLGGVQMRAVSAAELLGVPFLSEEELPAFSPFDALILCKYWKNAPLIRAKAKLLIFDPLDCWSSNKDYYHRPAEAFWDYCIKSLAPNVIVGTTPSACMTMVHSAFSQGCHVGYLPHHADPRIPCDGSWYNPDGPIVYAGGSRYIAKHQDIIARAATKIGKALVLAVDDNRVWKVMHGASLVLNPRFAPTDTALNRFCKPQVKLENAVAAKIPILSTNCPCVTSYCPQSITIGKGLGSVDVWAEKMQEAIAFGPIDRVPVTLQSSMRLLMDVIQQMVTRPESVA